MQVAEKFATVANLEDFSAKALYLLAAPSTPDEARQEAIFMNVADRFNSVNLTDLNFAPSALYLLAAPSTPDEARQEAIFMNVAENFNRSNLLQLDFAPSALYLLAAPFTLYPW